MIISIEKQDMETIIKSLAENVRAGDNNCVQLSDSIEKERTANYTQIALLAKVFCRQEQGVIDDLIESLELQQSIEGEDNQAMLDDLLSTLVDNSTEFADNLYMHDKLRAIMDKK